MIFRKIFTLIFPTLASHLTTDINYYQGLNKLKIPT